MHAKELNTFALRSAHWQDGVQNYFVTLKLHLHKCTIQVCETNLPLIL